MGTANLVTESELKQFAKMSTKDKEDRALFFATQLMRLSIETLRVYVSHGKADDAPSEPGNEVSDQEYRASVKELVSASIWLTLLDQTKTFGRSEWLEDFFFLTWDASDYLHQDLRSQDVLDKYPNKTQFKPTIRLLATNLCQQLKLGDREETLFFVGERIFDGRFDRAGLLQDALKAPAEDLIRLAKEPLPAIIA